MSNAEGFLGNAPSKSHGHGRGYQKGRILHSETLEGSHHALLNGGKRLHEACGGGRHPGGPQADGPGNGQDQQENGGRLGKPPSMKPTKNWQKGDSQDDGEEKGDDNLARCLEPYNDHDRASQNEEQPSPGTSIHAGSHALPEPPSAPANASAKSKIS